MKHRMLVGVVAALLGVGGCGGGGGDGGGSTPAIKAWGTAQLLETNAGNASGPQIAFDRSGNALAVWEQSDGTRDNIWANRFSAASGTWGTAQLIETDDGGASGPRIAFDGNGNAIAVWSQSDGTRFNIWANRFSAASGTWSTAQSIEPAITGIGGNAGDAFNSRIAIDSGGNALVVWQRFDGTRDNIWASRFSAGSGAWGTAQLLETDNAGDANFPQIAVGAGGNALAVWQQSDGTRFNIWANRFSAGSGTWGTAQLIETDDAGDALTPQIAVDAGGDAVAVWTHSVQSNTGPFNIWANRFKAGSGWGTPELVEIEDGTTGQPQVAFDAVGNAIAVWVQIDPQRNISNVRANRLSAGSGAWGAAQVIGADAGDAGVPQIAFDANGNGIAVWHQSDGTRLNVRTNRFSAGSGAWGTAQLLETDDAGDAGTPQIAFDAAGNAIAVWVQSDGARFNIWANRFH